MCDPVTTPSPQFSDLTPFRRLLEAYSAEEGDLLEAFTSVCAERDKALPEEVDGGFLFRTAQEFRWDHKWASHVWCQNLFGLYAHKTIAALIKAETGPYLHEVALMLGRDAFGTFEPCMDDEDWAHPITRLWDDATSEECADLVEDLNLQARWVAWPERPEETGRVTFREVTEQDIEDRVAGWREQVLEMQSRLERGEVPEALMPHVASSLRRQLEEGLERRAHALREALALPPARRLREVVDELLPIAREDWEKRHDPDEDWNGEWSMLPVLSEVRMLLDFGKTELAFLALKEHWQACFCLELDPDHDHWMDVDFGKDA